MAAAARDAAALFGRERQVAAHAALLTELVATR
jgi:hypothetical protein